MSPGEPSELDPVKTLIDQALAPVAADLDTLSGQILSYIPVETESARRVLRHVLTSGGKRIRPALYFMCCRMLGYRGEHYFPIAAVTEFVHTASLLHDDVVDNSTLRRGKPTANSIYGDETSVLVGDLVYSTASEMMAATGDMEIVRTFARAIRLMSDGELLQLESLFKPQLAEATYLRILECKTAILIEAACKSAGLLARLPDSRSQALARFGHGVGMAFQLIDDALDYTGSQTLIGKATLSDLAEGKVTMPVILLMKALPASDRERLEQEMTAATLGAETVQEVARLIELHGTAEQTVERAQTYTESAMSALLSFPPSADRDVLENLANRLLFRFN